MTVVPHRKDELRPEAYSTSLGSPSSTPSPELPRHTWSAYGLQSTLTDNSDKMAVAAAAVVANVTTEALLTWSENVTSSDDVTLNQTDAASTADDATAVTTAGTAVTTAAATTANRWYASATTAAASATKWYASTTTGGATTNTTTTTTSSTASTLGWTSPPTTDSSTTAVDHSLLDVTTAVDVVLDQTERSTDAIGPTTDAGDVVTTLATTVVTEVADVVRRATVTVGAVAGPGDGGGPDADGHPGDQTTRSGIPVSYIWLPYVVFSLVLVGLMVGSFIRFHKKNGHKYKRRRAELWRQLNMENILQQVVGAAASPPNGRLNAARTSGAAAAADVDRSRAKPSTSKPAGARKSRRPLVFNSNLNGSMVDVRCGLSESLSTFRTRPTHPNPLAARSSAPPRNTGLFSASKSQPTSEDEVLLLQQTRL